MFDCVLVRMLTQEERKWYEEQMARHQDKEAMREGEEDEEDEEEEEEGD
jgi:hypothetical protein